MTLHITLTVARKAITQSRLKKDPASGAMWQPVVKGIYIMEKITFTLIPKIAQFTDRWSPCLEVMGEVWSLARLGKLLPFINLN